jgi:hypothetical protein
MAVGITNYPALLDTPTELIRTINDLSTTIGVGGLSNVAVTANVVAAAMAPVDGTAIIVSATDPTIREVISYTGRTATTLTGLTRGLEGSGAKTWAAGALVYFDAVPSLHRSVLVDAILALEAEVWRNPVQLTGLTTDGTGNNTATINAQLAAIAAAQGANTGGATAMLPRGVIMVGNILVPNHVRLVGHGVGTVLRAVVGTTGSMVALVANHNRFVVISDLRIDGNGAAVTGIRINTQDVANDEYADGSANLINLLIHNCGVDGIHLEGRGEDIIQNIRIRDCSRYGLNVECVDNDIANVVCATSGAAGVRVTHANNRFTNVKSYFSGFITPATGYGFWFDGSIGGHTATLVNCESQDNNNHNYYAQNFDRAVMVGCVSDSGNAGNNGSVDQSANGVQINGSSYCHYQGSIRDRGVNVRKHKYSIGLVNGASNLSFDVKSDGALLGHIQNGWHTNISGRINGYGGENDVAYAAAITPDPTLGNYINVGVLTGPITVNLPAVVNVWTGAEMSLRFVQDATGGKYVTFASGYVLKAPPSMMPNARSVLQFIYNGVEWIQIADNSFLDSSFRIQNVNDRNKQVALELGGITTGNTRVLTVPNVDGVILLSENATLTDLADVTLTNPARGHTLMRNAAGQFINTPLEELPFHEEFDLGSTSAGGFVGRAGWSWTVAGTGSVPFQTAGNLTHPGIAGGTCGAAVNAWAMINTLAPTFLPDSLSFMEWMVQPFTASGILYWFGLCDAINVTTNNTVMATYDTLSAHVNWMLRRDTAAASSIVSTGVPVIALNWYKMRFDRTASGAWTLTVTNMTSGATGSASVTGAPTSTAMYMEALAYNRATSTLKNIVVDYVDYAYSPITRI